MMMCDDELAFVDDATGHGRATSNGTTDDAGDVDAISGEGFLPRFFDVGTEVRAGAGVCVSVDVGVALVKQSPPK